MKPRNNISIWHQEKRNLKVRQRKKERGIGRDEETERKKIIKTVKFKNMKTAKKTNEKMNENIQN